MPASMTSMVVAEAAVVAASSIETIMEVYIRTHISIRISVVTRIIIARIHNTTAQQYHDSYQKEKFFHMAPPRAAFFLL